MKLSHSPKPPLPANDPQKLRLAIRSAIATTLLLLCFASPLQAAITWDGDIDPADPTTWTNSTIGYIGKSSTGSITVDGASVLQSYDGVLASNPGSSGTVTVTDTGSKWTNNYLYVGRAGIGALNIKAGGVVVSHHESSIGYCPGSTGTATVTGTDSCWTIDYGNLYIGNVGVGALNIEAGGQVNNSYDSYLGKSFGSSGAVSVIGNGSKWTNNGNLYLGYAGNGTLTVNDGGTIVVGGAIFTSSLNSVLGNGTISSAGGVLDADFVFDALHGSQNSFTFGEGGTLTITPSTRSALGVGYKNKGTLKITEGVTVNSSSGFLGYLSGAIGTATVAGTGSTWTNNSTLYVGYSGTGTLNIEAGGQQICNKDSYLGYNTGSTGTATVTGVGSTWNNWGDLYVGRSGTGILNIEAGGQVFSNSDFSILGYDSGDSGTAIVTGNGSKWSISSMEFSVGLWGSGTLKIEDGGQLDTNNLSEIGTLSGSIGTVTVTGAGSKWTNSSALYVGLSGTGILNIEAGGQVFGNGFIGFNSSSCGTITVTGNGSKLISGSPVGYSGIGTLNIEAGGFVTGVNCLGYNSGSSGYVTVTGIGSKCSAVGTFYVGLSGAGILNIGNGIASEGTLNAKSFTLANSSSAIATCNLNGGTLQTSSIAKGSGTASFNWSDGTIRNYNASTDLTVSGTNNLTLKLAATGTHSFNIDAGRKGTVAAVLCDATSGGTLAKQGDGLLVLSAVNTYTGTTTIESGQLKLVAGGDIAFSSEIINRAGFMIDGGDHSVKKITGSGAIQVLSGSLTAGSIVQDTLTIGGTTNAVPEPASLVLLAIFGFAAAGMAWRRRER